MNVYPNQIETITSEQMLEAYSQHAMPIYYDNWAAGMQLEREKEEYKRGRMGLAYEVVINSNPCISYLMEENTLLMQVLVMAHACMGHNHFFKNNYLFKEWTDAESIIDYLLFAKNYIREQEEIHGFEAVDAVVEGSKVKWVIVESKSGRQAILGKIIIDATGDGDVAIRAGASYQATALEKREPSTLMFRIGGVDVDRLSSLVPKWGLRRGTLPDIQANPYPTALSIPKAMIMESREKGELKANIEHILVHLLDRTIVKTGMVTINSAHLQGDACSNVDLTSMEILARKQNMSITQFLKNNVPGFENCFLVYNAATMGIRETRRIVGDYILTKDDILTRKKFEDTIANNRFPMQGHGPGVKFTNIEVPHAYSIPYRTLLPKGLDNIFVGGRDIAVDYETLMSVRTMPCCFSLGQAAGTAAALSIKNKVTPRDLDVKLLQKTLMEQDAALNLFKI